MNKTNQAIIQVANITVKDVMQAVSWCDELVTRFDTEISDIRRACILAKNETEVKHLKSAERETQLNLNEFARYRACLLDLLDGEQCEWDLGDDDADPVNVRILMTEIRDARYRVLMKDKNVDPIEVLGDPNRVSIRDYMLRVHPDRVRECNGSLRLTCCGDLVLENDGYLIGKNLYYTPVQVLTEMLGYDRRLAQKALLGSAEAICDYMESPASRGVHQASVVTATDNFHYVPSKWERRKEGTQEEYLREKGIWIPSVLFESSDIRRLGRKIAFINEKGDYMELVDPDHCNEERARYAVDTCGYWSWQHDQGEVKALFVVGCIRDACLLIRFFDSFMTLDGIVFASIGSSGRTDAAIQAIYDNQCGNIYLGLFNRGSVETVREVERIFDGVELIPWKERVVKNGVDGDTLANMMPEKVRSYYFSIRRK
ncbi:MAG: hypothetical protein PUB52_02005 [Lachnospiraceae bacterium]|nr:hypothetical protein [Lachnospiraceae bacterium]